VPHLLTALGADINLPLLVIHSEPVLVPAQVTFEWFLVNHRFLEFFPWSDIFIVYGKKTKIQNI
jgi:hypothetical protein